MKRNLLFHLYPIQGPLWAWHVEKLLEHKEVWNGRRIVNVVLDHKTESEGAVLDLLSPLEAEVRVFANDPDLGETRYFHKTLSILESIDPNEATFYAHGKGVTRHDQEPVKNWSLAMYEINLGHMDYVDVVLKTHCSVGCFRQITPHAGSPWHYSGTFFWIKHSAIFSRNWKEIEIGNYGVEGYPGKHIRLVESCSLTPEGILPLDLYNGAAGEDSIRAWRKLLELR